MLSPAVQLTIALFLAFQSSNDAAVHRAIDDYRARLTAQRARETEANPTITAGQVEPDPTTRRPEDPPIATPASTQADLPAREALLTEQSETVQPTLEQLLSEIPDPTEAKQLFEQRAAYL